MISGISKPAFEGLTHARSHNTESPIHAIQLSVCLKQNRAIIKLNWNWVSVNSTGKVYNN